MTMLPFLVFTENVHYVEAELTETGYSGIIVSLIGLVIAIILYSLICKITYCPSKEEEEAQTARRPLLADND